MFKKYGENAGGECRGRITAIREHMTREHGVREHRVKEQTTVSARLAQVGLTVVELLIVFSVIAVIFLLSAPGVSGLMQERSVKSASNNLFVSLNLAKSEATKRHGTVRICPSSDGVSCRQDGDWNRGWLMFSDGNDNALPEGNEIIQIFEPPGEKIRIYAKGALAGSAGFTIAGLLSNKESDTGEFKICHIESDSGFMKITADQEGYMEIVKADASCDAG